LIYEFTISPKLGLKCGIAILAFPHSQYQCQNEPIVTDILIRSKKLKQ